MAGGEAATGGRHRRRLLGVTLTVAAVIGAVALLTAPPSMTVASVRLDDHETNWPDHVEVQNAGAEHLDGLLRPDGAATVEVRSDRSTVRLVAASSTDPAMLDAAVSDLVSADVADATSFVSSEAELATALTQAEAQLDAAVRVPDPDLDEVRRRAEDVRVAREVLAEQQLRDTTGRSRFVALESARTVDTPSRMPQWVLTAFLVLLGGLCLLEPERLLPGRGMGSEGRRDPA